MNNSSSQEIPDIYHFIWGSVLFVIGSAGVFGNGLVLFIFTRFRRLRGPFSSFIINLAFADFCTSIFHIMVVISSFRGQWVFGSIGCKLYAFVVGFFGLVSIITLSVIALERYLVITAKPFSGSWKITECDARKVCCLVWFYCSALVIPPLLGWSDYIPEGFLTSCSWDYTTRTATNRAYYLYLLTFGFVFPVLVIVYCYIFILMAIVQHREEMKKSCDKNETSTHSGSLTSTIRSSSVRSLIKTIEIITLLILLFLLSWTPYAVVTLIGQFGNVEYVTPLTAALPALFAKASVVYNPIIYGVSHPTFRSAIRQYMSSRHNVNMHRNTSVVAHADTGVTLQSRRCRRPNTPLSRQTTVNLSTNLERRQLSSLSYQSPVNNKNCKGETNLKCIDDESSQHSINNNNYNYKLHETKKTMDETKSMLTDNMEKKSPDFSREPIARVSSSDDKDENIIQVR